MQENSYFDIIRGRKTCNATKTIQKVSLMECATLCLRQAECSVAGYHIGSGECQFSSNVVVESAHSWEILIPKTGKWHYD